MTWKSVVIVALRLAVEQVIADDFVLYYLLDISMRRISARMMSRKQYSIDVRHFSACIVMNVELIVEIL